MKKEKTRCGWAKDGLMCLYHDKEWGVPIFSDPKQFEFLVLESAQAGLSWSCVLNKRENYRKAFAGFDPQKISKFNARKIESLLKNAGIIRNRLKIESAVQNAKCFLALQKEFGSFSHYIWSFVEGKVRRKPLQKLTELPAVTPESLALSQDMKKRGFKFLGPTVLYSHMQATGLVNDHLVSCFRYREIERKKTKRKRA